MVETDNLTTIIADRIKKAQKKEVFFEEIYSNSDLPIGKNEFVYFIKPEITIESDKIKLEDILELMFRQIESFGFHVHNIKILSADYLEKYNIIADHYGVINKISSNAIQNMSELAKEKLKDIYGKDEREIKTLGGNEFLNAYPVFNAYSLDYLWQNLKNNKIASGTYCEQVKVDDKIINLINGFAPRQIKHYTEIGRSIVVFTLSGDISWKNARDKFIGATNPLDAKEGSLRRILLERKEEFGLAEISQAINGCHLSAGPVESLIELKRYNSNFSKDLKGLDYTHFPFGSKLKKLFQNDFDNIISNTSVLNEGKKVSIFDLTEEKDSDEVIEILKQIFSSR